jgi:hypothetical protein
MPPPLFTSTASNPGFFHLSREKLARLHPELLPGGGLRHWLEQRYADPAKDLEHIAYCLHEGDCRAAIVVSLHPLLVAAYSDEFDAVVLLKFDPRLAAIYDLAVGQRLVTVNNYEHSKLSRQTDFHAGELATGVFTGFYPLIADFLTDDDQRLTEIKQKISQQEWQRAEQLGRQKALQSWPLPRDGRPKYACFGGGWLRVTIVTFVIIALIVAIALKILLR